MLVHLGYFSLLPSMNISFVTSMVSTTAGSIDFRDIVFDVDDLSYKCYELSKEN